MSEKQLPKAILDNIEEIKKIDKSDMLSFCVKAVEHYNEATRISRQLSIDYAQPRTIVVAGMGGSGIGGELLKDWARDKVTVPIEVSKEYSLPKYANKKTLAIIASYSGETEESLSSFLDAIKRKCMVFCTSSGGTLLQFAERLSIPYLRIPLGMPPRAALPYMFLPMLMVLYKTGLVSNVDSELSEATKILEMASLENSPERPIRDNFSKTLASNIGNTIPVVYGFGFYRSVALRFKQQFNENSKAPSKWESFPELNHNEIVGWEGSEKLTKLFSTIFLRDRIEPEEIRNRIEKTKELISAESSKVFEVWSFGKGKLAKMLSTICIGDFVSIYLAVLHGVDPTPVKTIALLKEKTKQGGVKEKIIRDLQRIALR
ncbi:MAG: bifunctional phosphoglucose/phosphomannose isomerase [Candidatus Bathycorpusculaceae bacterium]